MTSTNPSDGYMLTRGLGASIRLLVQQCLWRDHFECNLYPEIEKKPGDEPIKIAELATGERDLAD
jgi:hypothetical protein